MKQEAKRNKKIGQCLINENFCLTGSIYLYFNRGMRTSHNLVRFMLSTTAIVDFFSGVLKHLCFGTPKKVYITANYTKVL